MFLLPYDLKHLCASAPFKDIAINFFPVLKIQNYIIILLVVGKTHLRELEKNFISNIFFVT